MVKTMITSLIFVFSSAAFASDILLSRQLGRTSCYMTSSYVGLIYAGEEVDGREPRYTDAIPNVESLKTAIEFAAVSGAALMPQEIFAGYRGDAHAAYTNNHMVVLLSPTSPASAALLDLLKLNCSPE